jgi:hypothetical protein
MPVNVILWLLNSREAVKEQITALKVDEIHKSQHGWLKLLKPVKVVKITVRSRALRIVLRL